MNIQLLIDSIVRQTTVLIAQLATAGGARAPLAHIANQVFLDLARELESQGVGRKVSADMFGLALRSYQRKIQRLAESQSDRGRSLWEAVVTFLTDRKLATRSEILQHFHQDDSALVRSVLHDLTESGLIFRSGSGASSAYRIATDEDLGALQGTDTSASDALLWVTVYRNGPVSRDRLIELTSIDPVELDSSLLRLMDDARISELEDDDGNLSYHCAQFLVPLGSPVGWEAAVLDHYQAMVQTFCTKLSGDVSATSMGDQVGGSTYSLVVWPGHPIEEEARGLLAEFRDRIGTLRKRIDSHNESNGKPGEVDKIVVYVGQHIVHEDGLDPLATVLDGAGADLPQDTDAANE